MVPFGLVAAGQDEAYVPHWRFSWPIRNPRVPPGPAKRVPEGQLRRQRERGGRRVRLPPSPLAVHRLVRKVPRGHGVPRPRQRGVRRTAEWGDRRASRRPVPPTRRARGRMVASVPRRAPPSTFHSRRRRSGCPALALLPTSARYASPFPPELCITAGWSRSSSVGRWNCRSRLVPRSPEPSWAGAGCGVPFRRSASSTPNPGVPTNGSLSRPRPSRRRRDGGGNPAQSSERQGRESCAENLGSEGQQHFRQRILLVSVPLPYCR